MCLYPRIIENRKYKLTKKNGGNIPPITDPRTKYVPIGCMECIECRKQRARGWQVRLLEDIKENKNAKFITLTLSNESICKVKDAVEEDGLSNGLEKPLEGYELDNAIATKAVRYFLERWRKEYGTSVRHWLVTELGHKGTENIHIHGLIWTDNIEAIEKHWQYGWIWKGNQINGKYHNYVNEKTVNYIIKYITKADEHHKGFKSKILSSKGIGAGYHLRNSSSLNKYRGTKTKEYYKTRTGHKINLPIYYRNKIYTEYERERLWLQKLDKEERWVCGEKITIKHGDKDYENIRAFHRIRNTQLGYGNGYRTEEEIQYQRMRRNIMMETRIQKANTKRLRGGRASGGG